MYLPDIHKRRVEKPTAGDGLVLEGWAEGLMVGSLIMMSCITLANMRRGVLLHKLILLELVMGYWQGFFIIFSPPVYAWWLNIAGIFLDASWSLHNVIAWIKLKPFLSKRVSYVFIWTVAIAQLFWVWETYASFAYFHNVNTYFMKTRPYEALFRDPWWIVACVLLFHNIRSNYDLTLNQIFRISPRFAIMLAAMVLSIVFLVLDILAATRVLLRELPVGINPFWKLSYILKCLTDCVILDDFKTALDRLHAAKMRQFDAMEMKTTRQPPGTDIVVEHRDSSFGSAALGSGHGICGGTGRKAVTRNATAHVEFANA